ncbi:fatty acyl-CoA reductase 1-like [Haemaphysalis longicornis]
METMGHQAHLGQSMEGVKQDSAGSQIAQFYRDQVVFITGGTGFIGKVLLEKLLRSCPGVKEVYLLVRGKKGEQPEARIEAMLKSKVFERLKQEQPTALKKVKTVAGDLTQENLGLTSTDQDTLVAKVTVVFHSAAAINFNEPLKRAVELNILGTWRVVDLCKKMSNLRALVHVSTAYCNCDKPEVDEVIYPPLVDPTKIIAASEWMDDKMMDMIRGHLFGQYPNTYTITKALAESLVLAERGTLPVAMVRPSVVVSSWKEPFPGWVDNYYGSTGIAVACSLGLLNSLIAEENAVADIIPVDLVANTLIGVAWHTAITRSKDVKVYHCTSGTLQPQTWGDVAMGFGEGAVRDPLPDVMRFPKFYLTNNFLWHDVKLFCLNYLPACFADLFLKLMGRKPRFVPLYRKARRGMDAVQYFSTHSWLFRTDNMVALLDHLSPADKQLFNFDIRTVQWRVYWDQYMLGIRKYLFNADVSNLPQAKKRLKWLYAIHLFLNLLPVVFVGRLVITRSETARNLCYAPLTFPQRLREELHALPSLPWRWH